MTKEDFELLSVGDVVRYGLENYEVIEISKDKTTIHNSEKSVGFLINKSNLRSSTKYYSSFSTCTNYPISFCLNECYIAWKDTEQNSIEYYEKKIEETKSELNRLSTILNGLQESKRMKELTETLSNLIVGDFYTVKDDVGNVFTGQYKGTNVNQSHTFDLLTIERTLSPKRIKQIIHHPNFSNEYRILLKKIDTFNKDMENT